MFNMTRRTLLGTAAAATAFGLAGTLEFIPHAFAATPVEPTVGFYRYKVGIDRGHRHL